MIHFPKCPACPVDPGRDCFAQVTGAAHAYCRRLAAGDAQACALVVDHSAPEPEPGPVSAPESNSGVEEAAAARAAKPRIPLGVAWQAPADCIPCQEAAATRSTDAIE